MSERALLSTTEPPSDFKMALVDHDLANTYQAEGKNELALATFEALVSTFERILGPEHSYCHSEKESVAAVKSRLGRSAEALKALEEEKRWWIAYQPGLTYARSSDVVIAAAMISEGRAAEALELLKHVDLKALEAVSDEPDMPSQIEAEIGRALSALGRAGEGVPRLRKAIASMKANQVTPGTLEWYGSELRRFESQRSPSASKRKGGS